MRFLRVMRKIQCPICKHWREVSKNVIYQISQGVSTGRCRPCGIKHKAPYDVAQRFNVVKHLFGESQEK